MRNSYSFILMLFVSSNVVGQNFTSIYNFANVNQTTGLNDPTPVPTATGVAFGSFSAVGQSATNPNATGRFSFTGWPTGATTGSDVFTGSILTTQYYQVIISPSTGFTIDINSITFTLQRSGTGIRQYAVRSSMDGYAANLPASIEPANTNLQVVSTNVFQVTDASTIANTGSTITLDASYDNLSAGVIFRFYGWNSESSGGTFSIDDVAVSGLAISTSTLPVNFARVKASQQTGNIKIEWSNLTELDVIHYSIERSSDSSNFTGIGQQNATLNNGSRADYIFIDGNPINGINYYRIRSWESAGIHVYSIIVRIDFRVGTMQLILYPNPVSAGLLCYQAANLSKGKYIIRITNAADQVVYLQSLNHPGGSVSETIQLPSGIKAGLYRFQLNNNKDVKISRSFLVR